MLISSLKYIYSYSNAYEERIKIFQQNRNKSGIYLWTNTVSGKSYVGSSINLSRRIRDYFNKSYLTRELLKNNSLIYKALLEHNYKGFRLDILEYCEKNAIIEREQYYLTNLTVEYNVLKHAKSLLGFKHKPSTIEILRKLKLGIPCSESTKEKLSQNSQSIGIKVKDLISGKILLFNSIKKTADFIQKHPSYISKCLNKKMSYCNKQYYVIKNNI